MTIETKATCDRCGDEATSATASGWVAVGTSSNLAWPGMPQHVGIVATNMTTAGTPPKHLCKSCYRDFNRFLDMPRSSAA